MSGTTNGDRGAHQRWVWLSLVPFGFGSWAPLIPARRYRRPAWAVAGLIGPMVTLAGFIAAGNETREHSSLSGLLLIAAWFLGIVISFVVRSQVRRSGVVAPAAQQRAKPRRDKWPWISLFPLGLGAWAPLIAGDRCDNRWWKLAGITGLATSIAGFALAAASHTPTGTNRTDAGIAGLLWIAAWMGGISASFAIRPAYEARLGLVAPERPRWPRPTPRSRQWTVRYVIAAYVITFTCGNLLVALLVEDVIGANIPVGTGVLIVDAGLLLALVPLARRRGLSLKDLGIRPTPSAPSLWLVVQALMAYFLISALYVLAFIGTSTTHAAGLLSQVNHVGTVELVVSILAISISAPVVEEIFFRGLLYRGLRNRLSVPYAALISGAMFGFVHITGYPLITLPIKALFGVIACLLYERTGSLLPGMALHSFVDATGVDIALTGNDYIVLSVAAALAAAILLRFGWQKWNERGEAVPIAVVASAEEPAPVPLEPA